MSDQQPSGEAIAAVLTLKKAGWVKIGHDRHRVVMAEVIDQAFAPLRAREAKLREALDAADDVISWYESEHERNSYEDTELPQELLEAEANLEKARAALAATTEER